MAKKQPKPFVFHSLSEVPDRAANWPLDPSQMHPAVGPARVNTPPPRHPAPTVEEIDDLFGSDPIPNWSLDPTAGEPKSKTKSRRSAARFDPTPSHPAAGRSFFDDTDLASPLNMTDPTQVFKPGTDALDWAEDDRDSVVPNWDLDPTRPRKKGKRK